MYVTFQFYIIGMKISAVWLTINLYKKINQPC